MFAPGQRVRVLMRVPDHHTERLDGQIAAVYTHGCDVIVGARGCWYIPNGDIEAA